MVYNNRDKRASMEVVIDFPKYKYYAELYDHLQFAVVEYLCCALHYSASIHATTVWYSNKDLLRFKGTAYNHLTDGFTEKLYRDEVEDNEEYMWLQGEYEETIDILDKISGPLDTFIMSAQFCSLRDSIQGRNGSYDFVDIIVHYGNGVGLVFQRTVE